MYDDYLKDVSKTEKLMMHDTILIHLIVCGHGMNPRWLILHPHA